jgi:hypothetical protein
MDNKHIFYNNVMDSLNPMENFFYQEERFVCQIEAFTYSFCDVLAEGTGT